MDKMQALCVLVCLAGVAAAAQGFAPSPSDLYQPKADESEDASTLDLHNEDIHHHADAASDEDVLGDHKDILAVPKDLLGEDLEDYAKHGGDPSSDSDGLQSPGSGSSEAAKEHQYDDSHGILEGFERQPSEEHDQPEEQHPARPGPVRQYQPYTAAAPTGHSGASGVIGVPGASRVIGVPGASGASVSSGVPGGRNHHGNLREKSVEEYGGELRRPEYAYRYGVHDPDTRDVKTAWELRDGDHTQGGYSVVEPDGHTRVVQYSVSKGGGFNAHVKRLPPQSYTHRR